MPLTPQDERLQDWLDGELSPDQAAAFERELLADPALRQAAEAQRAMRDLLRQQGPVPAPPGFADRVFDALDDEPAVVRLAPWRAPLGVPLQGWALAAVAVVVLWLALPSATPVAPVQATPSTEDLPSVGFVATPSPAVTQMPDGLHLLGHDPADVARIVAATGGQVAHEDGSLVVRVPAARADELRARLIDLGPVQAVGTPRAQTGTVQLHITFDDP